jgi:hypothetical protein
MGSGETKANEANEEVKGTSDRASLLSDKRCLYQLIFQ